LTCLDTRPPARGRSWYGTTTQQLQQAVKFVLNAFDEQKSAAILNDGTLVPSRLVKFVDSLLVAAAPMASPAFAQGSRIVLKRETSS
jgi:hypothetical protein